MGAEYLLLFNDISSWKRKFIGTNIFQHMMCGDISWQNQRKEKILVTLETTYLLEMNKVELVSEGHGKIYIQTIRECSVVWY